MGLVAVLHVWRHVPDQRQHAEIQGDMQSSEWCDMLAESESAVVETELTQMDAQPCKTELDGIIVHVWPGLLYNTAVATTEVCCD